MGMAYRSKSPARILNEIDALARRYKTRYLGAVDNILDHHHIEGVFGALAAQSKGYKFFYEVKANLRREQIRLLAAGGIRRVQPGIESLNSHILKLMRKGVSGIKNVRLMKWAAYYKMGVAWNLLLGFPGETEEDYEQQLDLIKQISHLPPPLGASRISLQRFSPNFTHAAEIGFDNVRPIELIRLYLSRRYRHSSDRVFLRIQREGHFAGHRLCADPGRDRALADAVA